MLNRAIHKMPVASKHGRKVVNYYVLTLLH